MFVHSLDLQTEAGGEILLVANHDVYVPGDLPIDLLRPPGSANGFPKRWAVVQIIRDDRSIFPGFANRFDDQLRRGVRKRRKNPSRVQPPSAEFPKNVVP